MKKNGGAKKKEKKKKKEKEEEKKHRDNKHGYGAKKVSEIDISKIRTPYNSASDEYRVSFISNSDAADMRLGIKIGSDDDNMSRADIQNAELKGNKLSVKDGMIDVGSVTKGEKVTLSIKLSESGRRTLEVRAYAES